HLRVGIDVSSGERHRQRLPVVVEDRPSLRRKRHRPQTLAERELVVGLGVPDLQDGQTEQDAGETESEKREESDEPPDRRPVHGRPPTTAFGWWRLGPPSGTCRTWIPSCGRVNPKLRASCAIRAGEASLAAA